MTREEIREAARRAAADLAPLTPGEIAQVAALLLSVRAGEVTR